MLLAVLIALPAGCARVEVHLTAYLSRAAAFPEPKPENSIGVVVSSGEELSLLEAEVADKIAALLRERDYTVTPVSQAAYVLSCRFWTDGGQTHTRTVAVHEPGEMYRSYYYGRRRTYAVHTTVLPGYTRYVPQPYTAFTHALSLALVRLDSHAGTQPREAELRGTPGWQCEAHCLSESSDLRWLVNHLLLAAFDRFGQDTGRAVRVSIGWQDERVKRLAQPRK